MDAPNTPVIDENNIRSKLASTGKYTPQDIDTYVNWKKNNQPAQIQQSQAPTPLPNQQQKAPQTSIVGDFGKEIWNGFIDVGKGIAVTPKIVADAMGSHAEWADWLATNGSKAIDNIEFNIPKENEELTWDNPRSWLNNLGKTIGLIGNVLLIGGLTGGAGDVAEGVGVGGEVAATASEGLAETAAEAGAKEATAKTVTEAAQNKVAQNFISGSAKQKMGSVIGLTANMLNPVYESGKQAGLSDAANARFTMAVAPLVGMTALAGGLFSLGPEEAKAITADLPNLLKPIAEGATKEEFQDYTKRAVVSMMDKVKMFGPKEAATGFGQTYFMGAVQQAGEQLYDTVFADKNAEAGKGKFGANVLGKKEFVENLQNGILGGVLGMGMSTLHGTPVIDQTLYGYLDSSLRAGNGDKAIENVNKVIDSKQLQTEQKAALKEKVKQMSAISSDYAHLGDKMDADGRYEAYNLNYNLKPKFQETINGHEALEQKLGELQQAEKLGNPHADPALMGGVENKIQEGMPAYQMAKESVDAINKHLFELGKTGQRGDISKTLSEITQKHSPKIQEQKAAEEKIKAEENDWEDLLGAGTKENYDNLSSEDLVKQYDVAKQTPDLMDNDIKYLEKLAGDKNIDLTKTSEDASKVRSNQEPVQEEGGQRQDLQNESGEDLQRGQEEGAATSNEVRGVKPLSEIYNEVSDYAKPEEVKDFLHSQLKEVAKDDKAMRDFVNKLADEGKVKLKGKC